MRKTTWIGLIIVIIGVIGSIVTFKQAIHPETHQVTDTFSVNDISALDIETNVAMVEVKHHEADDILVESKIESKKNGKEDIMMENRDGILTIHQERLKTYGVLGLFRQKQKIIVYLPKDANIDDVNIESDVAEIALDGIEAGAFDLHSSVGRIHLTDIVGKSIQAKSDVGQVELEHTEGTLDVTTDVGEIKYHQKQLTDSARFNSSVGNIEVTFEEMPKDAKVTTSSSVSHVNIFGDKEDYIDGNGNTELRITTDVGSVDVTKE